MGACDVTLRVSGDADAAEVKRRLGKVIERAKHEHGHGGYSGSWAEKNEYDLMFVPGAYEDEDAAARYGDEHADKWGATLVFQIQPKGKPRYWFLYALASE